MVYQQFETAVILDTIERVDSADPDAAWFKEFQTRLRDGKCTKADWRRLAERSEGEIGPQRWREQFVNADATWLFNTNREVLQHNMSVLAGLGNDIVRINAQHVGGSKAKREGDSSENVRSLCSVLYLAVGAKVLLTWNLLQEYGLVNGSTGTVVDIIYREGERPPDGLPEAVIVQFDCYRGPRMFEDVDGQDRSKWVPITPTTAEWTVRDGNRDVECSRRQLPLRLSWAWTVWKAQGQSMSGKVVLNLGESEKEHGLSYVAFSRATRFDCIGLAGRGVSFERLEKIKEGAKLKARVREEVRLRAIAAETVGHHPGSIGSEEGASATGNAAAAGGGGIGAGAGAGGGAAAAGVNAGAAAAAAAGGGGVAGAGAAGTGGAAGGNNAGGEAPQDLPWTEYMSTEVRAMAGGRHDPARNNYTWLYQPLIEDAFHRLRVLDRRLTAFQRPPHWDDLVVQVSQGIQALGEATLAGWNSLRRDHGNHIEAREQVRLLEGNAAVLDAINHFGRGCRDYTFSEPGANAVPDIQQCIQQALHFRLDMMDVD
jgi:hypothetical protein